MNFISLFKSVPAVKRINRLFPIERNENLINEVNKMLFIDAFDYENCLESGEYLKKVLCIGLIGDYYRKKFYFCLKKYREKNKEKINEKNKEYYHSKMQNPEYKEKLREQARLRYQKKKNKNKEE
jgi:hypothetical protein